MLLAELRFKSPSASFFYVISLLNHLFSSLSLLYQIDGYGTMQTIGVHGITKIGQRHFLSVILNASWGRFKHIRC
jgi:hypothetical protein